MSTLLSERPRRKHGECKARLCAMEIGEVLPERDPLEINNWRAMALRYKIRLQSVPEGLKRVG